MDSEKHIPLVADLDGTLLKSDALWEGLIRFILPRPWNIFICLIWLCTGGKAGLKERLAPYSLQGMEFWPLDETVLGRLRLAQEEGRPIYLATASHKIVAEALAARLGLFTGILATENGMNLRGEAKASLLREKFGQAAYDYIGNGREDLPIWRDCRAIILAGGDPSVKSRAAAMAAETGKEIISLERKPARRSGYAHALRCRQWLKNCLVGVPLLLAHLFTVEAALNVFIAFMAFCACASSIYIFNDLSDLDSDRQHPLKRLRPFAAGDLPLIRGPLLFCLSLGTSLVVAALLPHLFVAALAVYFILNLAYSTLVKKLLFLDVLLLTGMYTLRVIAGSFALNLPLSNWLLAFCCFIFMGLALIKRFTELDLQQAGQEKRLPRRAYIGQDRRLLESMAVCCCICAVLVLSLYIDSLNSLSQYSTPQLLWLLCPLGLYWLGRLLLLANRGDILDDPLDFAIKDKASLLCLLSGILILLLAI